MKHTKRLGLAAVAALALAGFPAVASASPAFDSTTYPASISGESFGAEAVVFETQYSTTICDGYTSTAMTTWSNELVADGAFEEGCIGGPIQMNGCKLSYRAGTEVNEGEFNGTLGWSGCSGIVTYPAGCKTKFAPTNVNATFENSGAAVIATVNASNLKYTRECAPNAGKTYTDGKFRSNWKLVSSGGSLGILPEDGLYLTGEQSAEEAKQPKLNAERYAAKVIGVQDASYTHELEFNVGALECGQITTTGLLSSASKSLNMGAAYGDCFVNGLLGTTVQMNSCRYEFDVLNATPLYSGSASIVCNKGDAIVLSIAAYAGECVITIPSQSGLVGLTFANTGSGKSRQVKQTFNLTGITYSISGACGKAPGTFTDGVYRGISMLSAVN